MAVIPRAFAPKNLVPSQSNQNTEQCGSDHGGPSPRSAAQAPHPRRATIGAYGFEENQFAAAAGFQPLSVFSALSNNDCLDSSQLRSTPNEGQL